MRRTIIEVARRGADGSNDTLPAQSGNSGKYLTTDGTDAAWVTPAVTDPANFIPGWTAGRWYSVQQQYAMDWGANTGVVGVNSTHACPIWVPDGGAAIDRIGVTVNTGVGASTIRLMAHEAKTNGLPGALLFDWGTVSSASSGDKDITITATLPQGLVLLTCICSAAVTLGAFESYRTQIFGGTNPGGTDGGPYRDNGSMTAPNPWGTTGISYRDSRLARLAVRAA